MADSSAPPSDEAKSQQTRELLFKRHPQLQGGNAASGGSAISSPAFGGVGTRQFLAKQTPGSVTSASSYEDGASYDGFSEEGTPASLPEIHVRVAESKTEATEQHGSKHQPTKRLTSPSRRSLARRLLGTTTTTHGVFAAEGEGSAEAETLEVSSPAASSTTVSRQVVSPGASVTRRVLRRTDADGTVHEEIQYVDADGKVVRTEGSSTSATQASSVVTPGKTTVTRRVVTPGQNTTLRRVVTRHTGADGQVREVVKLLDAEGNVVSTEGDEAVATETGSTTSTTKTTPGRTTVTRRTVSPGQTTTRRVVTRRVGADGKAVEVIKYVDASGQEVSSEGGPQTTVNSMTATAGSASSESSNVTMPGRSTVTRRRVVRRAGADGKVREEVQYVDANDNIVQIGDQVSPTSQTTTTQQSTSSVVTTPGRTTVTHRVVSSPAKTLRRRIIRRTGADGKVREEVQYLDTEGKVVSTEDTGGLETTSSFTSQASSSSTGTPSRRTVTRRRVVMRKTGADGKVREEVKYLDADGNEVSSEGAPLSGSGGSFTTGGSVSSTGSDMTSSRRSVTRRRVVTRKTGSDGKVDEVVQYLDAEGNVVSSESGSESQEEKFSTPPTPNRVVVTRRVVSPARVVKRTYVSKSGGSSESGQDSQDEVQSLDDEDTRSVTSVTSETSIGGTPGRRLIKRRVVTKPRSVVRRTVVRKDGSESGMDSQDEMQSVDDSEGSVSGDSSRGVASSRSTSVIQHTTTTPARTIRRRVSVKMGDDGEPHEDVQYLAVEGPDSTFENDNAPTTDSFPSDPTTPTRKNMTTVTEPMEGESPQSTQKIGLTPSVVWDYFPGSETSEDKPESVEGAKVDAPGDSDEEKTPIPAGVASPKTSTSTLSKDEKTPKSPHSGDALVAMSAAGAAGVATLAAVTTPTNDEPGASVAQRPAGELKAMEKATPVVEIPTEEPLVSTQGEGAKPIAAGAPKETPQETKERPRASGGFWGFFGRSEDKEEAAPKETPKEMSDKPKQELEQVTNPEEPQSVVPSTSVVPFAEAEDQRPSPSNQDKSGAVDPTREDKEEPKSPRDSDALRTAVVAGATGVAVATTVKALDDKEPSDELPASADIMATVSEPTTSADEPSVVETTTATVKSPTAEQAAGGFWNFFSKPEEKAAGTPTVAVKDVQQQPDEAISTIGGVAQPDDVPVPTDEDKAPLLDTEEVAQPASEPTEPTEVPGSPRNDPLATADFGAVTGTAAVTAAMTVEGEAKPDMAPVPEQTIAETLEVTEPETGVATPAKVVPGQPELTTTIETTTTTETTEEGGFWSMFGKAQPKKPEATVDTTEQQGVKQSVETLEAVSSSVPGRSDLSVDPTVEDVTESFVAPPGDVAMPSEAMETIATSVTATEDVPAAMAEAVVPEDASLRSPREHSGLSTAAIAGVTGVAAVAAAATSTSEEPSEQKPASAGSATTTAEKSTKQAADQKRRYGKGPVWKFWGLRTESQEEEMKGNTPATVESQQMVQEENVEEEVTTTSSVITGETTDAPTPRVAREFWENQDKQPKQVQQPSYVAAVGAKYGPESKYDPAPAVEKIQVGAVQAQSSGPESPREEKVMPAPGTTLPTEGLITTEITTTTVEETEETEYALRMQRATAAATLTAEAKPTIEAAEENVAVRSPQGSSASDISSSDEEREEGSWTASRRSSADVAAIGGKVRDSERRTTALTEGDLMEPDVEMVAEGSYVEVASPRQDYEFGEPTDAWTVKPCTIAWSKLRLSRDKCKGASATALGDGDMVLSDVSGSVKAGEFLVITGPAKGESLALLSCLAGYQDAMEGNVTVNGRKWNKAMDRYVAYVQREDLFFETLTVHEHLVAQAQLRMRRTHSDVKCLERVEAVIEEMGLTSCRDKLIGGGISVRGISRGERKLLALATALLTNPSILLVEEPTDGLDTFVAERIVAKLRQLAFEKGLTVAVTLHHPASHFYVLFDVLYLVTEGSCVYDGKAQDCVPYFATLGYQCPLYMSPMDYFLIQMVVGDRESDDEGAARLALLKREWADRNAEVYAVNAARAEAASEESTVDDYDRKNRYYHMGCCGQLWLLWARHIQRLSRYGFVFGWHALAALLIGVVLGLVYLQLDLNNQQGIQNFAGAFFYSVVVQMLFHAYRTFVFAPREVAIALRERQEYRGSWYYLVCWYMSKIIAELPALIVLSILLFVPVFLLVGIGHGFTVYVYMQILIVLAGWAAIALAFLALGVLRRVTLALVVYSVLLILFVVFGGLLINVSDIPDWLIWLHYISPIKYAHEAMMKIFWSREDIIGCASSAVPCIARTGDQVLAYYGMESRSALGDTLILLGICLALFFVAFWFLLVLAQKHINGFQWRFKWTFSGLLGNRKQRAVGARVGKDGTVDRHSVRHVYASKSRNSSLVALKDTRNHTDEKELNHYIQVETPRIGGRTQCDAQRVTLGWSSLWLKKPATKDKQKHKKSDAEASQEPTQKEYLLSDASGSAKCGEVVLITGPSDRANVALLESLGGFQSEKKLRGRVTMNGEPRTLQQTDELVAYVPRDELFHETLTVQEHLRFQAQLCVAKGKDRSCGLLCCGGGGSGALEHQEAERVEAALEEVELQAQRHVLIRYLSPADRKLLAIATALLSNPSVLLVEEPTQTERDQVLDFHAAQRVILKLRQLARSGRTVVVTLAHPSSHVLALFDMLYLLAAGAAVYHGKVSEVVPYFASLGYECPEYESPVDFLARQVTTRSGGEGSGEIQAALFKEAWSTRYSELLCLAEDGIAASELTVSSREGKYHRRHLSCCGQLALLFRRHVLRLARYSFAFLWHALFAVVAGVIFGLIFLKLDPRYEQGDIQNVAGALFYLVVVEMVLMAARTLAFLPHELQIAEREHRGGNYYLVCWFLTKLVAEIPSLVALSVIFFVPAYLLIDFGHGFDLYVYMQLVLALCGWGAIALTLLALAIFRRLRVALLALAVLLLLFIVFGGLLINVDDVPDYLIWLHYISPVKFGYETLMKLFWTRMGLLFCGETGDGSGSGSDASYNSGFPNVGDEEIYGASGYGSGSSGSYYMEDGCLAHSGEEVLQHFNMEETERTAQADGLILLELVLLYFFLGYAILSLRWRSCKTRRERPQMSSSEQSAY